MVQYELYSIVKPVLSCHSKRRPKLAYTRKTDYRLMQIKKIAECSKGSILQHVSPSLSYQLSSRSFLSTFEWPLKKGFTAVPFEPYNEVIYMNQYKDVGTYHTGKNKIGKKAKISNRYNQVPHLTQDTVPHLTLTQDTKTSLKRAVLTIRWC